MNEMNFSGISLEDIRKRHTRKIGNVSYPMLPNV